MRATLLPLLLAAGCIVGDAPEPTAILEATAPGVVSLVPSTDIASENVVGVGDTANLYRDVDDGTTATSADDSTTYVRGASGAAVAAHTVGYTGAPDGTVTAVTVHYRAQRGSASGTIQVELYDGTSLVASGPRRTLGSWKNYSESFTGLMLASASQLRTRVVMRNTKTSGALRYTQIWVDVTVQPVAPPDPPPDATPSDYQPTFPIRAAFYYPWFPNAWTQGGVFPFTNYHPSDGYYDSHDPAEIRKHIATLEYAGMHAAISSWWGQGHHTDTAFATILATTPSASSKFRWALYYEAEGNYGNPTIAQITSDLTYLRNHYASDPSVLRVNGRFVVFVYGDGTDGCDMADRWAAANTVNAYIVLKVFNGYRTCAHQPDSWHQYSPAVAADSQSGYSYAIAPGFYLKNQAVRLARDPARWTQNVRDMLASNAPWQLVTTFNEWGEGTAVESATEWASPSGYGTYVDTLHSILPAP